MPRSAEKFQISPLDFSKSQGGNSPLKVGGERILGKFSGGNPPLPPRDRGGMTTLILSDMSTITMCLR